MRFFLTRSNVCFGSELAVHVSIFPSFSFLSKIFVALREVYITFLMWISKTAIHCNPNIYNKERKKIQSVEDYKYLPINAI